MTTNITLFFFSVRAQELVDSLYSKRNVPTILQSLGFIAQYSVSNFETQVEEITSYICQKIIQVLEFNYKSCLFNLFCQNMLILWQNILAV